MELDDPRRELLRVHRSIFLSQAPSNRCVVCLTELTEHGHTEGLICSKTCNNLVSEVMATLAAIGHNISHRVDDLGSRIKTLSDRISH